MTDRTATFEDHPLSEIFPLMRGREFEELVHDIKENGLREPITLFEGMIIDGRNRYRACQKAGIDSATETYEGQDPLKFVISRNLIRRHLKENQRAFLAANLATAKLGDNQHTMRHSLTRSEAAQLLQISETSVALAVEVKKHAVNEIKDALQAGLISTFAAAAVARLPSEKQCEIFKKGKRALVAAARKSRGLRGRQGRTEYSILWKCVDDICDALEQSRIDNAHMAATRLVKELDRVAKSRRPSR